ncbi:pentapeptide repeat-containing protein [Campylobacter sp. MRC_CM3]|uniref:pentapeptide repeat-containing protein n=1 Tax=Campylobacter molothri TaxID=1032242 RepID=UPI0035B3ADB7
MKYKWMIKDTYIKFRLNKLIELINSSDRMYFMQDANYSLEIYIKFKIFSNFILVCDILDNWWRLISKTFDLDKSHIKYNYLLNTFIVSDFNFGIKLDSDLLKRFNFEFCNGLISNQLSITNGLLLKRENYNRSLKFSKCNFNKTFCIARVNVNKQIIFNDVCFDENILIDWVSFNENSYLKFFKCNFENQCGFENNIFCGEVDFINVSIKELILKENIFNKFLYIQNSIINNIDLWKNKFKNRCYFMDSKFGYMQVKDKKAKLNFSNAHFQDNVYFNNSHFYDYVDFHECEFEKNACFYGVKFEKIPNFSQAIFKGNLNAVNANLNFDFDDLKEKINQECEEFNKNKKEEDEKSLDKFANDFRDSFRIFKNALIKDNNLLDASNFHKYELYCKEIELKQSWNKLKNVTTDEDIKQNNRNHSQLVDFLLLGFYRKLCDHHTDLLRVLNNLILLISLYVLYNFFILYISGKEIINDTKIYLSDIFHNNIFWYIPGILLFVCICSIYFCKNKEKTHVINREIKIKKFQWCKIIIKEILNFLFVCMICYMGISIFGIVGDFLAKFFGLKIFKDVVYISFACLSFFGLFLFFINSLVLRYLFISFSYFVVAFVLFLKPKEFYFIYNIFKDDDKNLAIMSSLNVVYFTLIILVLFSLQKTARKNSIVPS